VSACDGGLQVELGGGVTWLDRGGGSVRETMLG